MSKTLIRATSISRSYGSRVALESLDFEVSAGQICGLVGPNGSGKTTLLKIIGGFLRPHAGELRVLGHDPFLEQEQVMENARFAFAPPALFEHLTPAEHLEYLTGIGRRRTERVDRRARDEALDLVGLSDRSGDPVSTFSFGMRQRLVLAQALLPMPELLVLDEPTDGLDPIAILELRELLLSLREERGVGIMLSSHLLSEIEELVDTLLVLSAGRCVFSGSPASLTAGLARLRLRASDNGRLLESLLERGIEGALVGGEVELDMEALTAREAVQMLESQGLTLEGFRVHVPGLEVALLDRMRNTARESRRSAGSVE